MARPRKWQDDAERRAAQGDARKAARQAHNVNFIGVDGEGIGRWRNHRYVMLGVGENSIQNPEGLSFMNLMDFLYTMYRENPGASFVGFYLGYDFCQWFKKLPENRARMLLTESGRQNRLRRINRSLGPFPVVYDGWEFDILGMKRFKLRPEGTKGGWMYINDAGPFFQASLMSTIDPKKWEDPIVTEAEYAILQEGKARRDHAELDSSMVRYNALENDILARLMGRVNEGLVKADIRLHKDQWFGPGQAAQAWLRNIKAPDGNMVRQTVTDHRTIRNGTYGNTSPSAMGTGLEDAARASYYGGWFEIFAHGHIPGHSWEYDINSAYPHIISNLPCFLHGIWEHGRNNYTGGSDRDSYRLVHARVRGTNRRIGAMLHRCADHTIRRPSETAGWYWQHEIDAAIRAGVINDVDAQESWTYYPCSCRPPIRAIAGLYEERLRVGKNSPHGKGLKLVYNSVYGKFAQSVGEPKYGNAFYASLVTAGCRAMILDCISSHPEGVNSVVMVATDGVYFRRRHTGSLDISERLGGWEETQHDNLCLFKPGVYWDDAARSRIRLGSAPGFKARGIQAEAFASSIRAIDDHFGNWPKLYPEERDPRGNRDGWFPRVTFKSGFSMITCQQALQRGKWFLAGAVQDVELEQDSDPIGKRHSGYFEDGIYWSQPFKDGGPGGVESTPYDRRFGQPDPDEYGLTDDGTVKDTWVGLLKKN